MKRVPWLVVVAACGGHDVAQDGAVIDAPAACTATYSGNFVELATTATACGSISSGSLALDAPSVTLASPLAITIALGDAPTTGPYSSETVGSWDARGTKVVSTEPCLFVGGSDVTPTGSFTLALDALAPPHGTLDLVLTVLQTPFVDCGADLGETVEVVF